MLFLGSLFFAFVAFPEREDAILSNEKKDNINIETSGSLGLFHFELNKCLQTNGSETLTSERKDEWCSMSLQGSAYPYIQYSINEKLIKIQKYSLRNGCCYYSSCCEKNGSLIDDDCCCELYSYSLSGSNDKRTWITLHKVEKDKVFYHCLTKTFELDKNTRPYKYIRFSLDEEYPGYKRCLQINQIEFYGTTESTKSTSYDDSLDDEESISIIGRIKKL